MADTQPYVSPPLDGPEGIGGWLILPVIGLCLTPLRALLQLGEFSSLKDAFAFLTGGQKAFLVAEMVLNFGIILVLPIVLLVLLFNKKATFPRVYVIWAVLCLVFLVGDLIMAKVMFSEIFAAGSVELLDADTLKDILRTIVLVAVWVPYMLNSRRVRNTFVQ